MERMFAISMKELGLGARVVKAASKPIVRRTSGPLREVLAGRAKNTTISFVRYKVVNMIFEEIDRSREEKAREEAQRKDHKLAA